MNRLLLRAFMLFTMLTLIQGCRSHSDAEERLWSGSVGGVFVQWTAESGIDLATEISVPIRAYLESYQLVQLTGDLASAYPGFVDAVPSNEPANDSANEAAWARRPSVEVAPKGALVGNLKYHLLSTMGVGSTTTAIVCSYTYGLGEEVADGQYRQYPTNGDAESRGIWGTRLTMRPPSTPSRLPPQTGEARAPADDVFDDWQIIGYETTAASSDRDWPEKADVDRKCVEKAPDPLERRGSMVGGPHSKEQFRPSLPSPGWPANPQ